MFPFILFAETCFCGSLEKSQKLEPAKISCHTACKVDAGPFQIDILHMLTRKCLNVFKAIQAKTNI